MPTLTAGASSGTNGCQTCGKLETLTADKLEIIKLRQELSEEGKEALQVQLRDELPLVKVRIAIRKRFLQLVIRNSSTLALSPVPEAIEAGNRAAHRGDFAADVALYKIGCLDPEAHAEIFEHLYEVKPSSCFGTMLIAGIPCRLAVRNMMGSLGSSLAGVEPSLHRAVQLHFDKLRLQFHSAVDPVAERIGIEYFENFDANNPGVGLFDRFVKPINDIPELNGILNEMHCYVEAMQKEEAKRKYY